VRRLVFFAAVVVAGRAATARADWQVRRTDNGALVEQAARALGERPDDDALARRLVRIAGKGGSGHLVEEFRAAAGAVPPRYASIAAYAQLLLALGRFDEAVREFELALAARPGATAALVGRARALASAGHRTEALAAYDEALRAEQRPRERRRLLDAALALVAQGDDIEREIALRREVAALEPSNDAAAERLADALERAGRPADAAAVLEQRVPAGRAGAAGARTDLVLRAATLRDAAGDSDRAASALSDLIRQLPAGAADWRRETWRRAVEVARHRNALPALAGELARAPGPVEWEMLSQVRDELGDLDGALEAARRAQAHERRNIELGRRIVALLERLGRDEEAAGAQEQLARMAPSDSRFTVELIEHELRRGRRKEGGEQFDRAATRFGHDAGALAALAELASRWGEDRRALAAWERVRQLNPRDEMAILGLGEVQFQRGKKDAALRTWQALRERERTPAAGHLRLAEVLLEHDLAVEALAEAQRAQALEPKLARVHRVVAQILERQRKNDAAVLEWETVLATSAGPGQLAERREARARILSLLAREGRARLEARVRRLEEEVRRNPDDREAALFLAEAQQRGDNIAGAIATLRVLVDHDAAAAGRQTAAGTPASPDADAAAADAVLALVRLLRHTGQVDEAVQRLEDLARRIPAREREAQVQIADIELGRYDEGRALAHAERAARLAPGDGQGLARIAEIEQRAGDDARALATYREAFGRDGNATAAFALARLLERRGEARAAADVLRQVLRTSSDDEVIAEAGRRAIAVEEYLGRLVDFEHLVAGLIFSGQKGSAYRRVLVDVLRRLLPVLYRAPPGDTAAAEERRRIAQHGLRPLLELVTDGDGEPDRALIELLGMLGNRDAAPVLARLADAPAPAAPGDRARQTLRPATESQLSATVALGRLRDERARDVLEKLASSPDATLRAAAVWALGRVASPRSAPLLRRALDDRRIDIVALACLGLGRARGDSGAVAALATIAGDPARPARVRRAAALGLGLAGDRAAAAALLALLSSGDDDLERAAAAALGVLADARPPAALLALALLPPRPRAGSEGPAIAALDRLAAGLPLPDEATAIEGGKVDVEAMLAVLTAAPRPTDRTALWLDRTRDVDTILSDGLVHGGPARRRALEVLDSRAEGPGLGPLAPQADAPVSAAVAAALREVAAGLRDRIAALLDDPDPEIAAAALRLLAKLDDPRVTPARIAAAAAAGARAPALRDSAVLAAGRQARGSADAAHAVAQATAPLLSDPAGWERRLPAVTVLAALGGAGARPLEQALADDSPVVRAAAAEALAPLDEATAALAAAADDPVASVRAAVALALAGHSGARARAALERLARDEVPRVRQAASSAITSGTGPGTRP
jgi:tetratricopeptide (TPR) repeat protein/HEAT repeat protein